RDSSRGWGRRGARRQEESGPPRLGERGRARAGRSTRRPRRSRSRRGTSPPTSGRRPGGAGRGSPPDSTRSRRFTPARDRSPPRTDGHLVSSERVAREANRGADAEPARRRSERDARIATTSGYLSLSSSPPPPAGGLTAGLPL